MARLNKDQPKNPCNYCHSITIVKYESQHEHSWAPGQLCTRRYVSGEGNIYAIVHIHVHYTSRDMYFLLFECSELDKK